MIKGVHTHRPLSAFIVTEGGQEQPKTPTDDASAVEPKPEIPEKYQGKTVEEVIEMHRNAEKRLGELQNETGSLRGLVRDLSSMAQPVPQPQPEETALDVSGDELINDPVGVISKVVEHETAKTKAAADVDKMERQFETELESLYTDFGDFAGIVTSEGFVEFAGRTQSRQRDMQTAAQGEGLAQVRAARRLLEDYRDFQTLSAKPAEDDPVEEAKKVATENGSGTQPVITGETFTSDELVKMIQEDPDKWRSPSVQKEVIQAIKEGRYIPNA
jgi:hypothetical protein